MALVEYCCRCCDKSKRKVEDDANVSDPLLTDKEKSDAKFEEKGKEDKRGNKPAPMKKNMTVSIRNLAKDVSLSMTDEAAISAGLKSSMKTSKVGGSKEEMGKVQASKRVSIQEDDEEDEEVFEL
eukprot:scaffold28065_cov68-Cyclotella_meneghiniana.AAC.3